MINTKTLIFVLSIMIFLGCTKGDEKQLPLSKDYAHHFIATPINLGVDSTIVMLEDYFESPMKIDSIYGDKGLSIVKINDDQLLLLTSQKIAPLSYLNFEYEDQIISILLKKSNKKVTTFQFDPKGKAYKTVQLVGDVNAWNPANTPLKLNNGIWEAPLKLLPGTYQYQVVLDGTWNLDPNNPVKLENGIGGWNSKLVIEGANKKLLPQLYTKSTSSNTITIGYKNSPTNLLAFWENTPLKSTLKGNSYIIEIPKQVKNHTRSFVRIIAYNQIGVSNELLIPLQNNTAVVTSSSLTREDKATNITYFLLVDRFNNANPKNDHPLNLPGVNAKADYHGGDIEGVLQKLKEGYFESLGINTIWLSPIVRNPQGAYGLFDKEGVKSEFSAYHGYWPISFTEVDERFGSEAALKELVALAHTKDMNIFIDFVANHVHEEHPIYVLNKDKGWTTDLYLPDGTMNTEKWDEHRLTTWFDTFLPTLNLEKVEVAEMLSDSALYWVNHFDIDGFRHDAAKHIPNNFWRTLTKKVKGEQINRGKQIIQIGETYGTPELINSYINTGMLDGQFDFNVFDALLQTLCKEDTGFEMLQEKMTQSFEYYGVNNLMGYISGNQDRARFMALATGEVRFDEDSKLAGWKREINKKTPEAYKKLGFMNTILLTMPGIPVIFYGDEIGMTGGNDPDCRRMMHFDDLNSSEKSLKDNVSKVAHLRRDNMAFLYGDFTFLKAQDNILVYARKYFNNLGIVLINNSSEVRSLKIKMPDHYKLNDLKAIFTEDFSVEGQYIKTSLQPYSSQILSK